MCYFGRLLVALDFMKFFEFEIKFKTYRFCVLQVLTTFSSELQNLHFYPILNLDVLAQKSITLVFRCCTLLLSF